MKKEIIVTAKTIELAVQNGAEQLGVKKDDVTYEVLEMPKKGIFGFGTSDAKVKVCCNMSAKDTAVEFISKIIAHMNINAKPTVIEETKNELKIDIVGENLGILIGYHGEILDSLQYLTYLAVNNSEEDAEPEIGKDGKSEAIRISIDVENYRKKREETLQDLAKKMADRVLKYRRSFTLEPMSAYERRIIHATIQEIPGVTTYSIGQDNERKIVITKENPSNVNSSGAKTSKYPSYPPKKPYANKSGAEAPRKEKSREFKPYSSSNASKQKND